ncbi:hypothetical protein [Flavobacterium tructae]|uniref:hypothetical protein n=1 Tax=Flavobacterium tructae TaxID=1114873 RepID=UPI000F516038|nr:hypothetical protein [Flavobacterium tructae]
MGYKRHIPNPIILGKWQFLGTGLGRKKHCFHREGNWETKVKGCTGDPTQYPITGIELYSCRQSTDSKVLFETIVLYESGIPKKGIIESISIDQSIFLNIEKDIK